MSNARRRGRDSKCISSWPINSHVIYARLRGRQELISGRDGTCGDEFVKGIYSRRYARFAEKKFASLRDSRANLRIEMIKKKNFLRSVASVHRHRSSRASSVSRHPVSMRETDDRCTYVHGNRSAFCSPTKRHTHTHTHSTIVKVASKMANVPFALQVYGIRR